MDVLGVVTHPNWRTTREWGSSSPWPSLLVELGVRHTRGKLGTSSEAVSALRPFFNAGGQICVTIADQGLVLDKVGTKRNLDFLAANVPAANISGIESANEFNHDSTAFASELRDFQKWMRATVAGIPKLAGIPLIAPSVYLRLPTAYSAIGNLEPNVDRPNLHYYSGGRRPPLCGGATTPKTLDQAIKDARTLAPTKGGPYITETGYKVAGPDAGPGPDVLSELAVAKYLLRSMFDFVARDVPKAYIYSLLDDPQRAAINHGLVVAGSFVKRKAFYAIKNLTALFQDGGSMATGSLDYSLTGATASTRKMLFRRGDGTFLLVLYQDVDSWNKSSRSDINPAPVNIGVTVKASKVEVFTPTTSAGAVKTASNVTRIDVPVADHVVVVKITPGGTGTSSTTSGTSSTSSTSTTTKTSDPFVFREVN